MNGDDRRGDDRNAYRQLAEYLLDEVVRLRVEQERDEVTEKLMQRIEWEAGAWRK